MLKLPMFSRIIATVFFIGYFPLAPGTVATAFGMAFLWFFNPSYNTLLVIFAFSLILGIFTSKKMERETRQKDPSCVVIDEFVGYLASMLFIPLTFQNLIIAFIIFRILDIIKPPPIRQIERGLKGGMSIMMDDVVAGLLSNLLIRVFLAL